MKTLLVLAEHPELADSIRAALDARSYRVLHRASLSEAEPLLAHSLCDACILDAELSNVQSAWAVDKFRQLAPVMPLLIYSASRQWEWEEEAYLHGANYVLSKPVRAKLLIALLDRVWLRTSPAPSSAPAPSLATPATSPAPSMAPPSAAASSADLNVLRSFSAILTHSLDAEALVKQFLLLLREIVSLNRGAIFLRNPLTATGGHASAGAERRLQVMGALGVPTGLLQTVELSLDTGIGAQVQRLGRILKRGSEEVRNDPVAVKELELLSAQVAIPILDREALLGVAVFDGRITGESFINSELELIFHLLEQVGLAVKNIWLHTQLASNHEMMAGILRELSSGCVVVSRDLTVLHANRTAKKYFSKTERASGELEFSDLPQVLGSKVYQVLKTGAGVAPFKYEPAEQPGTVFSISIVPFQRTEAGLPGSALLMAEDLTQSQQLQRLEVETANLRLVRAMADRMTHEIGNAMVPLSTHQQLLADKWKDPEFRASLDAALADGVKRVTRLINQMRFLARDSLVASDSFPIGPLLEEAFQEARKHQPVKAAQLKYEAGASPVVLTGDRAALKHAFAEVMLNALQANPSDPKIGVRLNPEPATNGRHAGVQIEVLDNGAGFTTESARKGSAPFFTTRNVGLGLGLTVTRKIIETHHGRLEIVNPEPGHSGVVRISLPAEAS